MKPCKYLFLLVLFAGTAALAESSSDLKDQIQSLEERLARLEASKDPPDLSKCKVEMKFVGSSINGRCLHDTVVGEVEYRSGSFGNIRVICYKPEIVCE